MDDYFSYYTYYSILYFKDQVTFLQSLRHISADKRVSPKCDRRPKYVEIEIARIWPLNKTVIPIIIRELGMIKNNKNPTRNLSLPKI